MVAKGKLFAMEMLLDAEKCHIQLKEVERSFKNKMEEIDIEVFFLEKNLYKNTKNFMIFNEFVMKSEIDIKKLKELKLFNEAYKLLSKK